MNSKDPPKSRQTQAPSQNAVLPERNILISPVPQLLQSNFPPTEDEIQKIQEIILVAQREERKLKIFAGRVPRYTSSVHDTIYRDTQKLRKDVQNFIYKHQRLLSPLITLPVELLALIFVHCLPNLETAWGIRQPTWKDQPFYLSQICQRWRTVVLDTPQLWTVPGSINLTPSSLVFSSNNRNSHRKLSHRSKDPDAYVEFLQDILNRSKDVGLQLWLYASPSFGYHSYETFQNPLVTLLAKEASRITSLTIESSPAAVIGFCATSEALRSQSRSTVTFPRLRRLLLDLDRYPTRSIIDGFAHTPALTDVSLKGVLPFRLSLPWAQLRAYSETAAAWNHIGNLNTVLSSAKDLETLDVAWLEYDISPRSIDISQITSVPVKVSNVRLDFSRQNHHEQSINALLTHFHYPTVQTLRIESSFCDILAIFLRITNTHYTYFPVPPFTNLTSFYYRSSIFRPSHFICFLQLCPNLEELDIELPSHRDLSIFVSIYRSSNSTSKNSLVPALKRLFINCNFLRMSNEDGERALSLLREATQTLLNNSERSTFPHVRLIFGDGDLFILSKVQVYLNHWIKTFSSGSAGPMPLSKWRDDLHEEIPPLKFPRITWRGSGFFNTFRFSEIRLNAILGDIEKYRLNAYELRKLYTSGLDLTLHRLAHLPADLLPGHVKNRPCARARKILEKWEPLQRADLCSAKTLTLWAVKGMRSLVFIHPNDPLRTSPDALNLIYGLDDD